MRLHLDTVLGARPINSQRCFLVTHNTVCYNRRVGGDDGLRSFGEFEENAIDGASGLE